MLWQYWIKREIICTHQLHFEEDAKWFEDAHFFLQFALHAHSVLMTPYVMYFYRIHNNSAMHNSKLSERHSCSIALNIKLEKYIMQQFIQGGG